MQTICSNKKLLIIIIIILKLLIIIINNINNVYPKYLKMSMLFAKFRNKDFNLIKNREAHLFLKMIII